jgi:hypothetical protein
MSIEQRARVIDKPEARVAVLAFQASLDAPVCLRPDTRPGERGTLGAGLEYDSARKFTSHIRGTCCLRVSMCTIPD